MSNFLTSDQISNFIDSKINQIREKVSSDPVGNFIFNFVESKCLVIHQVKDKIPRYIAVGSLAGFMWYYGFNLMRQRDISKLKDVSFPIISEKENMFLHTDTSWLELCIELYKYNEYEPTQMRILIRLICALIAIKINLKRKDKRVNSNIRTRAAAIMKQIIVNLEYIKNSISMNMNDCHQIRNQMFLEFNMLEKNVINNATSTLASIQSLYSLKMNNL
jgi:hypothetical protein